MPVTPICCYSRWQLLLSICWITLTGCSSERAAFRVPPLSTARIHSDNYRPQVSDSCGHALVVETIKSRRLGRRFTSPQEVLRSASRHAVPLRGFIIWNRAKKSSTSEKPEASQPLRYRQVPLSEHRIVSPRHSGAWVALLFAGIGLGLAVLAVWGAISAAASTQALVVFLAIILWPLAVLFAIAGLGLGLWIYLS
jgi:hypothetical protein